MFVLFEWYSINYEIYFVPNTESFMPIKYNCTCLLVGLSTEPCHSEYIVGVPNQPKPTEDKLLNQALNSQYVYYYVNV